MLQITKNAGRVAYVIVAWVLVVMVVIQVFYAGVAVLVEPGNWQAHTNFGHLLSLPILLMALLSLLGWMPIRFFLLSLGLYVLYMLQYVLIYLPRQGALPAMAALHPVNALLILLTALYAARRSWQLATDGLKPAWRAGMMAVVTLGALGLGSVALPFSGGGAAQGGAKPVSLASATEADLPERYRAQHSPFPPADADAVAAGRQIAAQRCIACHAADFQGKQLGSVRSADLTRSGATRSEQFLLWAISEGSERGMPSWKAGLSEQERWQLVAFIKHLQ